jgi:hypothetical protein
MEEDYKIITIDSLNANYNTANIYDFYMNLDEPLRNVYKINVITILIDVPVSSSTFFSPLDPIYININDYNRLISKKDNNNLYYFDSLIIENLITSRMTIKNDYNTSDHIYNLNPIEPQLTRFNIRIFDKNNAKISTTNINRILIKLGVYYNNKKNTRV